MRRMLATGCCGLGLMVALPASARADGIAAGPLVGGAGGQRAWRRLQLPR